ncbi:MDR/zinc-dependent alcohol dehydrogenase-like family protein [Telluribacter humicola]|uniref:MDR/zinc-dependent alcohol dehydrogenase-like family protein n=1 Tax=Telluribacter humicola TaxID=1720261 RepID=UPI001A97B684|nr:zinc-binding dehydrogenase [Telluribacter humicola]
MIPEVQTRPALSSLDQRTGRSAVIAAPQSIEISEVPLRPPADDEICIKLEGCGLCSSNLPVWEGREWFQYPVQAGNPGHEGWGTVYAVGTNVQDFQVGDRVAVLSYNAFGEYDYAPATQAVKLPAKLNGLPFPGEPLGCAMNIFNRSDIRAGQTVAILGVGFLGALLVQLAKGAGARVIAFSRRSSSLDLARQFGADETIAMDDHYQIINKVNELTNGEFCDRVIECTGKEWPLNLAGELTRIRGKLVIAGFHQDGMRQVNVQLWNWRGLDVINAHERDVEMYIEGIRKAVLAVESGILDPTPLYTHTFSLSEINEAFKTHQEAPEGFVKALILNTK